jgi:hypothetical protein
VTSAYPVLLPSGTLACHIAASTPWDTCRRWALANLGRDVTVGPICEHDGDALEVPREPSPDDRNREHAMALIARTRREAMREALRVMRTMSRDQAIDELERRASHG